MQQQYGDEVEFVGVAGAFDTEDVEFFIDKFWVGEFPHLIDRDGTIFERYGVTGYPSIAFVDSDGTTELLVGAVSPQLLKKRVEELIG